MNLRGIVRYRTLILGILVLGTLVGSAVWSFDIAPELIVRYAVITLVLLGATIGAGLLGAGVLIAFRRLRRRR